jgi:release factor glutamine methyltransferase
VIEQTPAPAQYDLVVSNPPYIPRQEWEALSPSVRVWEDPRALVGERDVGSYGPGLAFYKRIADLLPLILVHQQHQHQHRQHEDAVSSRGLLEGIPRVAVEVGVEQAGDVQAILRSSGVISRTAVWEDQYGRERLVVGWGAVHGDPT